MALSSLDAGDSTLSDTGGEGNSCSVVTRQGVGAQDPQAACSDRMKAKNLMATVCGKYQRSPLDAILVTLEG